MTKDKLIYFGLLILLGCSANNEGQIEGHWHCIKPRQCEFETIDIKDSVLTTDKYIVGLYKEELHLDKNRSEFDNDVKVQLNKGQLILNYSDNISHYIRSDLQNCILADRYLKGMIDLSLPEVRSAKPFNISVTDFTTGDILIGKLKLGLSELNDKLTKQYPDSIFIQVNDVLINYKDITEYVRQLRDCRDCPRENVNLHVDRDVPEGVVGTVVKLINQDEIHSTVIHNVVKIENGDIGLLRR
jgi:hypothetical protein